jgi:myo-inositol-1(or 4)-monophosphatase
MQIIQYLRRSFCENARVGIFAFRSIAPKKAPMHPFLNTAVKAARKAAELQTRASRNLANIKVENKGPKDFVTEVDKASEAAICEVILETYPHHAIVGEEGTNIGNKNAEFRWIIDPIDGTHNFMHGVPYWNISIGCEQNGVVMHGLVYDPSANNLFTASRGGGAFLNNKRLRVSAVRNASEALVATGMPFKEGAEFDRYIGMLRDVMPAFSGIRRAGAAALDLAYVAAGWYDCFWEMNLNSWDVAAGSLLVQEAGGLVTDIYGEENYMNNGHIVAGNPRMFAELLKLLTPHAPAK